MAEIKFIDETDITGKKILLRVDFNVSLNPDHTISNDARIQQSLPTIKSLLSGKNKLIMISYLDRPKERDPKLSLKPVTEKLHEYLPDYDVILVDDFLTGDKNVFKNQTDKQILFLENIRFYPEEKKNDREFAEKLAALAEVYVNDAFGVCHRREASIVSVPNFLPAYGGLLLKKEIAMISKVIKNPQKPLVAIIGGAKIDTKIDLIGRLTEIADEVLIGGGLANTFLCGEGRNIGKSYCQLDMVDRAKQLLARAKEKNTNIYLPDDVVCGEKDNLQSPVEVFKVANIPAGASILDIGPETKAKFGGIINKAKTIIWNGPVGYSENPVFRQGTDFIYYSIAQNQEAVSIVGGGDTLAAISKKEYLDKITHISTGGGAMLEFIEKGTLPGIDALKK